MLKFLRKGQYLVIRRHLLQLKAVAILDYIIFYGFMSYIITCSIAKIHQHRRDIILGGSLTKHHYTKY